jgi:hypothetical protein
MCASVRKERKEGKKGRKKRKEKESKKGKDCCVSFIVFINTFIMLRIKENNRRK